MAIAVPEPASDAAARTALRAGATRVGVVRYINTLPMIDGLGRLEGMSLVPDVPARLIDRLVGGEVDLALCSVVDAVRSPVPVRIVPVGMIGCCGPTLTVRLYSRVPWDRVRTVAADTDSHTSRALAEVVLRRRLGAEPKFVDFARASGARDPGTDAMLMIGDKVIADAPAAGAWPHELDLGEAWHAWTGLPFVFATWLTRDGADAATQARVRVAARVLDHQRRHNRGRIDAIVAREAGPHGWPEPLARTYLRDLLRFDLDSRAREGLARFFAECAGLGLLPSARVPDDFAW
jgi:chorismate dehydratase